MQGFIQDFVLREIRWGCVEGVVEADIGGGSKDGGLKDVNFEKFLTFLSNKQSLIPLICIAAIINVFRHIRL